MGVSAFALCSIKRVPCGSYLINPRSALAAQSRDTSFKRSYQFALTKRRVENIIPSPFFSPIYVSFFSISRSSCAQERAAAKKLPEGRHLGAGPGAAVGWVLVMGLANSDSLWRSWHTNETEIHTARPRLTDRHNKMYNYINIRGVLKSVGSSRTYALVFFEAIECDKGFKREFDQRVGGVGKNVTKFLGISTKIYKIR